jgi:selenocysteine lyase/cysteine desulfurase
MLFNIKSNFPQVEDFTYLNTAASGLLSKSVLEFKLKDLKRFYKKGSGYLDDENEIIDNTKAKISKVFNADIDRIGIAPNYSLAYNAVLDGIPLESKFLCLEDDYFSVVMPVQSRGFEYHSLPITAKVEMDIYDYIDKNKPDVLSLSSVQYLSGIKINTAFFRKLKQDFPHLKILVDATQYLGTEKFDFKTSGIDLLISSCYKWLNAGFGNAITLMSEEFYQELSPKQIGSNSYRDKVNLIQDPMGFLEPGHYDLNTVGALSKALDVHYHSIGIDKIETQIKTLSESAFSRLSDLGLLDNKVMDRKSHSGIFMLNISQDKFEDFQNANIILSKRGNGLRISFHYYNTIDDLEHLISVLRA